MMNTPSEEIKRMFSDKQTVLLIGAGVSTAAVNLPGWRRLLNDAIGFYADLYPDEAEQAESLRNLVEAADDPQSLVEVADDIVNALKGVQGGLGNFPDFLSGTFDIRPEAIQPGLAQSICSAAPGAICTTNYDTVLEFVSPGAQSVSWSQPTRFQQLCQAGTDIYHIHGVWHEPETVVLGASDYERLHACESYREVMRALWLGKTIVFIGCSFDGISDPDLVTLLDWASASFEGSTQRHFALVKSGSLTREQRSKLLDRWRIRAIEYGSKYDDLPVYLSNLISRSQSEAPGPPDVFLGRDNDVDAVMAMLREHRHVQLTGLGGIGKTSIGAAVYQQFASEGSDCCWVEVAQKTESQLAIEVLTTIDDSALPFANDTNAAPLLAELLLNCDSRLIVFDCDASTQAVQRLVRQCDFTKAQVLLISRTRSVLFPARHEVPALSLETSIGLFHQLSGVHDQCETVEAICELLDGHPLAIVLAASRSLVESMPTVRMLERLKSDLSRLSTLRDSEGGDTRFSSIQACLSISMENLSDFQLQVLSLCSLPEGAPTLELLAAVLGCSEEDVDDVIGQLARRSLLQRSDSDEISVHRLIRDYLTTAHPDAVGAATSAFRSALTDIGTRLSAGEISEDLIADNAVHMERYIAETSLRSTREQVASAIVLGMGLFAPHGIRSRYAMADVDSGWLRSAVDQLVIMSEIMGPDTAARSLICRASVKIRTGDADSAIVDLRRAERSSFQATKRDTLIAQAKVALGNLLMEQHRYDDAAKTLKEALSSARSSGEAMAEAQATGQLGHAYKLRGDHKKSMALYERALRLYSEQNELTGIAACQSNLADLAMNDGDSERAWQLHHESFKNDWEGSNYAGAFSSLEAMANLASTRAHSTLIDEALAEVEQDIPRTIHQNYPGSAEFIRGVALLNVGEFERAEESLKASLQLREARGDQRSIAVAVYALSDVALRKGQYSRACQLAEQALERAQASFNFEIVFKVSQSLMGFHLQRGNLELAVKYGYIAVGAAAHRGDAWNANLALIQFLPLIFRSKRDMVEPCHGGLASLNFQELLQRIEVAAGVPDSSQLIGCFRCMTRKFLPDGRGNPGGGNSELLGLSRRGL